jgi:dnd system-associated protein 4
MALPRIKIAKDKAELIQKLIDNKSGTGPFQTYADVIAFAASLGVKYHKRVPLQEISNSEPAPISLEVFISRGYDWAIKLIAISETQQLKTLANCDRDIEAERIQIFEEYANGGLEKLKDELRGAVDYTERLLLILSAERFQEESIEEEFDLSRFL